MLLSNFRCNQAIAACFVTFGGLGGGFAIAWSATALPSLEETGQVGPLTSTDKAWISSLVNVGALIACPLSGQLMNRIGRRNNLIAFSFVAIPGWCLLVWGTSPFHLCVGRFLFGLSAGGVSVAIPVFIREISSKNNRGVLGSFYFFAICFGKAFSNVVGIIYPAHVASVICGFQPIIFILLLLLIPESPTFLVKKCRIDDATCSLSWLQYKGSPVPFPFSERLVRAAAQQSTRQAPILAQLQLIREEQNDNETDSSVSLKMFLTNGELFKPCLTAFILIFTAQLCGVGVLTSYTVEILQMTDVSGVVLDPKLATVTLGVLQAAACIPASLLVDRSGRRPLFLSSFVAMTLSMEAISGYFFTQQFYPSFLLRYHLFAYLPFVAMLVFLLSYSWGLGNIVFVTLSELLPPQVVGPASAVSSVLYWAAAFIVTQTFQMFKGWVSPFVWFAIYAGICFAGGCFTLVFLPETKGLSLEEIQKFYKSSSGKQKGTSVSETC